MRNGNVEVVHVHETKLESLIRSTGGKFFTAYFTKKNGENRRMTARIGVHKGVKGTQKTPAAHEGNPYKVVWDSANFDFRMINLATVKRIIFGGKVHEILRGTETVSHAAK